MPHRPERTRCPGCLNPVSTHMLRCIWCGERLDPRPPLTRICPRDGHRLSSVSAEWVLIDRCPGCRGEFYDADEFDVVHRLDEHQTLRVLRKLAPEGPGGGVRGRAASRRGDGAAPGIPDAGPLPAGASCPACQENFVTFRVPTHEGVLIDVCQGCRGMWLDEGESTALSRHVQGVLRSSEATGALFPGLADPVSASLAPLGIAILQELLRA